MTEGSFAAAVPKAVIDQIEAREKKFAGGSYSPEDLEVIHGNTVWCLLRSGVDAPKNEIDRYVIKTSEESDKVERTNAFAMGGILGGEEKPTSGDAEFTQLAGVQLNDEYKTSFYKKTEHQGFRPRPGITGFRVKTLDSWGMIMEAEINMKVWSRDDLDRMDLIYFKPGFPALFEWGHTLYFRPDGSVCKNPKKMVSNEAFFTGGEFAELDQAILEARQEDCNREAVFGYITNFSWSFNHDGSFDCSLKLLSKGAVLDGLKMSSNGDEAKEADSQDGEQWWLTSDYHRLLKCFEEAYQAKKNLGTTVYNPEGSYYSQFNQEAQKVLIPAGAASGGQGNLGVRESLKYSEGKDWGVNPKLYEALSEAMPVVPAQVTRKWSWVTFDRTSNGVRNYYISLETLCHIINCFEEPNNFGGIEVNSTQKYGHSDTVYNYTLTPLATDGRGGPDGGWSTQPSVTGPWAPGTPQYNQQQQQRQQPLQQLLSQASQSFAQRDANSGPTYMPSLNPVVALKPSQIGVRGNTTTKKGKKLEINFDVLEGSDTTFGAVSDRARILSIWVNYGAFVALVDREMEEGNRNMKVILEKFLAGIQKAFGEVNSFQLHSDSSLPTGRYEIVDASNVVGTAGTQEAPVINVSGLSNTVVDLQIKSDISQDLVNEMCIAATAPRDSRPGAENADECLIFWGENCKARWYNNFEGRIETGSGSVSQSRTSWLEELVKMYKTLRNQKISQGSSGARDADKLSSEVSSRFSSVQLEGEKYYKLQVRRDLQTKSEFHMGVIPYKTTITLLGLSRLYIGNTFRIRNGILPRKYDNWGYLITGIEHSIRNNQWFTTLTTNYYPIYPDEKFTPSPWYNSNAAGTSTVTPKPTKVDQDQINSAKTYIEAYEAIGLSSSEYYGKCARYTATWARIFTGGKKEAAATTKVLENSKFGVFYCPGNPAGGSAWDSSFRSSICARGYKEHNLGVHDQNWIKANMVMGKTVNGVNVKEGSVLVYFQEGAAHGHACFLSAGGRWRSDTVQNSAGVYRNNEQFRVYLLEPPEKHSDWA